jgi:pimeloyl-ACP methyl ester carboxylesterase
MPFSNDINHMAYKVPTTSSEVLLHHKRLAETQLPILMVWGDNDFYFPIDIATELYSGLPNAKLWVVPNQGHAPIWEFMGGSTLAAKIFPKMIREFLEEED